ncbi:hypothetical protein NO2_0721 [Candidatus Termititenax persephonae]|uniref:Replication-associated protein ORF2/G2P domain-containing protein n=1 Tax=Candidatus Termititenax persephonae TaxID=2218525 RepID=A0A388THE4_9BACT|nr:hypothetical protein NO2_0721 [Candidatus Termititenax persephonae]
MCLNPKYAYKVQDNKFNWGTLRMSKYRLQFISKNQYYKAKAEGKNPMEIPCEKCIECKAKNAQAWAARAYLESTKYKNGIFLTLSYNDENLPIGKLGNPTLKKEDITLFKKRLRKTLGKTEIRTFECGEYGEKRGRPHYHMIIWNYKPEDGRVIKQNISGDTLWASTKLEKIWGKGIILYGNVTYESAAYVARYVNKKREKKQLMKDQENVYINMSRKRGIGLDAWENYKKKYQELDGIYIPTKNGTKIIKIPRYFIKKWETELKEREETEIKEMTKGLIKKQMLWKEIQKLTLKKIKDYMKDQAEICEEHERIYHKMREARRKELKKLARYWNKQNEETIRGITTRNQIWRQWWEATPLYLAQEQRRVQLEINKQLILEKTSLSEREYDEQHKRIVIEKLCRLKRGLDN